MAIVALMHLRTWMDVRGGLHRTPQIAGRLKCGKVPLHARLRSHVIERDGRRCSWCGVAESAAPGGLVADHRLSRRNGGTHHPDNLVAMCQRCNSRKVGLYDAKGLSR